MVSITQIASELKVSATTVSKALNNKPGVSPERANLIREYARRLGYRPAYMARSLLRGSTNMIGFCLRESPTSPWYANLLHRIQHRCHEKGFYLNLVIADGNEKKDIDGQRRALDFFKELRVECVLLGPLWFLEEYNELRDWIAQHKAVIAFDAFENLPISHVKLDVYTGAQIAVEHLASRGHRRIGLFGYPIAVENKPVLRTRYSGFYEKMNSLGLEVREEWLIPTTECEGWSAYPRMEKLLDSYDRKDLPTAWFCQNDVFAAKLINILRKRNLHVPEDVAIVGFDNQPLAELTSPTLSSVGFDLDSYVDAIVEMTFNVIETNEQNQNVSPFANIVSKTFAPKLFVRESSG